MLPEDSSLSQAGWLHMVLLFPNQRTLLIALQQGAVATKTMRTAVTALLQEDGSLAIHLANEVIDPSLVLLTEGVQVVDHLEGDYTAYPCWAALLRPIPATLHSPPDSALIKCANPTTFLQFIHACRRLQTLGVRFAHHGVGANLLHLLRVSHPPALAMHLCNDSPDATMFAEQAPNVWVEVGVVQPFAETIRVPKDKYLLIHADGEWQTMTEPLFQPVDAKKVVPLAPNEHTVPSHDQAPILAAPSRLRPSRETAPAELWILHHEPLAELQAFVHDCDSRLIDELDFALSIRDDAVVRIALRARRNRGGPPALSRLGVPYAPLLKLPNTYIPVGYQLAPPIRRDVLREWLCRPLHATWLARDEQGTFTVESLPLDGFRPLTEWVEYLTTATRKHRVRRVQTTLFESEPFSIVEEVKAKAAKRERERVEVVEERVVPTAIPNVIRGQAPVRKELPALDEMESTPIVASEAIQQLQALEEEFIACAGPLDDPVRLALWPRIARLATLAGQDEDAGICWANALWEHTPADVIRRWYRDEARQVTDFPALLHRAEPRLNELRAVAVWLTYATIDNMTAIAIKPHLNRCGTFLERYDYRLPVRLAWVAWLSLARLSQGDVLALTRTRDRLLADLLEHGLRRDRDMPTFLRTGASRHSIHQHIDIDRFLRLSDYARSWCSGRSMGLNRNGNPLENIYVGLIFAFALAKFGDHEGARLLLADVGLPDEPGRHFSKMGRVTAGQEWIWFAYRDRVLYQLEGKSSTTPISLERRRELNLLTSTDRTLAEQFLQFSRILEPFERVDPYRDIRGNQSPLEARLAELTAANISRRKRDKPLEQWEQGFRELLASYRTPHETEKILYAAVPMSVRLGENFALECIDQVIPTIRKEQNIRDIGFLTRRVELLESAIGVAAHYDRTALIGPILEALEEQLRGLDLEKAAWFVGAFGAGSIRFLCRLGLSEAARLLLDRMTKAITGGKPLAEFLKTPSLNRGIVYPALLRLMGGWFYFEQDEPAQLTLKVVREELLLASASHGPRSLLASAYALALGNAPVKQALAAFFELFERLPAPTIIDPSMAIYMIQRLRVVEAVALSLASEDFAVDQRTRRWLDEDEYMIRRRIHRDVAEAIKQANL